jgi:hypothetical protein
VNNWTDTFLIFLFAIINRNYRWYWVSCKLTLGLRTRRAPCGLRYRLPWLHVVARRSYGSSRQGRIRHQPKRNTTTRKQRTVTKQRQRMNRYRNRNQLNGMTSWPETRTWKGRCVSLTVTQSLGPSSALSTSGNTSSPHCSVFCCSLRFLHASHSNVF